MLLIDAPEVVKSYDVTAGISFVPIVLTRDMASYEAATRRLFAEPKAVASFRTLVALDRVKAGAEIVIP